MRARKCKVCGERALGPRKTRAELLALIVQIAGELKQEVAHPLPPNVQTYERLEVHEFRQHHFKQGRLEAILEQALQPDVERICWDCGYKRRKAELERGRAELDTVLEQARADRAAALEPPKT